MGSFDEIRKFNQFLESLDDKVKYKVVIAGNHDLTFDDPDKSKGMGRFDFIF
jgi:metallophosphoesterase superfamily enzyme